MLPDRCADVSRRYCVFSRRKAWRGRHALGLRSAAASSDFKEYRLCNGLDICTPSPKDVAFIEKEVFVDATYTRKGLELAEGGVVIDCGANVGIFSVFAAQAVGRSGVVLALEPVPETFSCLEENIGRLRQWEDGAEAGRIVCTRAAVGDGSKESMVMTVYPIVSGWSTLYPDDRDLGRDMRVFLDAALDEQDARSAGIRSRFLAPLARTTKNFFLTRPLYRLGRALYIRWMMSGKRQVECDVVTISELLDRHALDKVDLLKVDVERAELDVLRGVQDRHWPCIRQVALECHEANLQGVRDLLEVKGFGGIETEQDEHLQGSSLHMLYARRQ